MATTSKRSNEVTPANSVPGPRQGQWTYSHYEVLPDDGQRYEIVDGVLYMSPSPNKFHQSIATMIAFHLIPYIKLSGLGEVIVELDLKLASKLVLRPDVSVFLNDGQETSDANVPPALVVEVGSPSTAVFDHTVKLRRYEQVGIEEYWIVDPLKQSVEVFVLEAGKYHSVGVFSGAQTLRSKLIPQFSEQVQQFFV